MVTSYTNRFGYKIRIDSTVRDHYFNENNNLKLYYFKDFDYTKLIEPDHDIKFELEFAIELFFNFLNNGQDYEEAKYNFFENSHKSFLYAKSMCQNIFRDGIHHPLGVVALNPLKIGSSAEKFKDHGWKILSDDLVIFMYSGIARLRYFKLLGIKQVPVFIQCMDNHNIDWVKNCSYVDDFEQLNNEYLDNVKYNTQFYQEDRFFYFKKDALDEKTQIFNKLTNRFFGVDSTNECLSHLVCCDMNNEHKEDGWKDENYIDYRRILKDSIPLKVYIGNCDSENSKEFIDCKNRILSSLYIFGDEKIDIEFRHTNIIGDIPKQNDFSGFAFYTDCNVGWDSNILELFYFTHSQKSIVKYDNNVVIVNCENEL